MKNPVITVMIVIVVGFLASHALMVVVSVGSWTPQTEQRRHTPDVVVRPADASPIGPQAGERP